VPVSESAKRRHITYYLVTQQHRLARRYAHHWFANND
jgi:hypothetical protein